MNDSTSNEALAAYERARQTYRALVQNKQWDKFYTDAVLGVSFRDYFPGMRAQCIAA